MPVPDRELVARGDGRVRHLGQGRAAGASALLSPPSLDVRDADEPRVSSRRTSTLAACRTGSTSACSSSSSSSSACSCGACSCGGRGSARALESSSVQSRSVWSLSRARERPRESLSEDASGRLRALLQVSRVLYVNGSSGQAALHREREPSKRARARADWPTRLAFATPARAAPESRLTCPADSLAPQPALASAAAPPKPVQPSLQPRLASTSSPRSVSRLCPPPAPCGACPVAVNIYIESHETHDGPGAEGCGSCASSSPPGLRPGRTHPQSPRREHSTDP